MNRFFSNKRDIFLMVLPGLAVLLFAMIVPIILSVYYGMTDWTGIGKMQYIGFDNFKEILGKDPTFWLSLFNALILTLVTLFLQNPFALIVCIMIIASRRGQRFFRTVYFIPAIISVVVTTRLWISIFSPQYGLLNKFLGLIGLGALGTDWLSNIHTAIFSVIFIVIWQGFGWAVLFYYSGLMGIPKDLQEAARIDGASGVKLYTKVVIPLMMPVIKSIAVIGLISCLKQMETVYLSTGGGPGDLTQFLANYLYTKAFVSGQYGYGNALSVLFVIICVLGTYLLDRFTRTDVGEY
jgi:raffinose/stachyose/melibiose transport system permease protein